MLSRRNCAVIIGESGLQSTQNRFFPLGTNTPAAYRIIPFGKIHFDRVAGGLKWSLGAKGAAAMFDFDDDDVDDWLDVLWGYARARRRSRAAGYGP